MIEIQTDVKKLGLCLNVTNRKLIVTLFEINNNIIFLIQKFNLYLYHTNKQTNANIMKNLLNKIDKLEDKRENGTITMDEEVLFHELVLLAENFTRK